MINFFVAHNKAVDMRKRVAAKVHCGIRGIASLLACAAIFLTGVMVPSSSPVIAQATKGQDALLKFQKERSQGTCKVTAAGYIFVFSTETFVELACPGKNEPILVVSPQGQGSGILSVAQAAISTGKQVYYLADDSGTLQGFVLLNP